MERCLIFFLLFSTVFASDCITFNFENGFDSFDSSFARDCQTVNNSWVLGDYSSISMEPVHPRSDTFMTSPNPRGCISTFFFDMEADGQVEVNIYLEMREIVSVEVYNEDNVFVRMWSSVNPFAPLGEWVKATVVIPSNTQPFRGYLVFYSNVFRLNTVLIDSFRYVPPNYDGECNFYNDDEEHVTTTTTTTTTTPPPTTTTTITTTDTYTTETESNTEFTTVTNEVTEETTENVTDTPTTVTVVVTETDYDEGTTARPEEEQKSSSVWTVLILCFVGVGFVLVCYIAYLFGIIKARTESQDLFEKKIGENPESVIVSKDGIPSKEIWANTDTY